MKRINPLKGNETYVDDPVDQWRSALLTADTIEEVRELRKHKPITAAAIDGDWAPPWELVNYNRDMPTTELGEGPGHPFRGNQWTSGYGDENGRLEADDYYKYPDDPLPRPERAYVDRPEGTDRRDWEYDLKRLQDPEAHGTRGNHFHLLDPLVKQWGYDPTHWVVDNTTDIYEGDHHLDTVGPNEHYLTKDFFDEWPAVREHLEEVIADPMSWEAHGEPVGTGAAGWESLGDHFYEMKPGTTAALESDDAPRGKQSLTVFAYETFGDFEGHPFRGNQWTDGAVAEKSNDPPEGKRPEFKEGDDYDKYRPIDQAWKAQMERALSMGTITEKEAEQRGYYATYSTNGWKPLPDTLYHVTTAKDAVERDGLKTRDELNMISGAGLGGGESNTISFTTDPKIAEAVEYGLREMHQVANGQISPVELIARAEHPDADEAPKAFIQDMMQYHDRNWQTGDPYPEGVRNLLSGERRPTYEEGASIIKPLTVAEAAEKGWRPADSAIPFTGGDGVERYSNFVRPMTDDEKTEAAVDFYKNYSFWRGVAGGRTDPLFFTSDTKALAAMDPDQFATLKFAPVPGAQGYQTSGMEEWRTKTGDAVQLETA